MNSDRTCPTCGTTLSDWLSKNRIGCSDCYTVFRTEISDYLRRMQGVAIVSDGDPVVEGETMRTHLESLLSEAIAREEYEMAAKLRDQISALKHTPSSV